MVRCVSFKRKGGGLYVHLKSSQCSRLQITLNVSWIHNAHKKSWSCEDPEFTKAKTRVLYKRGIQNKMIITSRGRMDICICMADSLHCPPNTSTILLTGYTPIQNKKLKKKIIKCLLEKKNYHLQTADLIYYFIT